MKVVRKDICLSVYFVLSIEEIKISVFFRLSFLRVLRFLDYLLLRRSSEIGIKIVIFRREEIEV